MPTKWYLLILILLCGTLTRVSLAKTIYGIDVSKYQGDLVRHLDTKDGLSFVVCKATEGGDCVDPDFYKNWRLIHKKKLVRGAYHFYRSNKDPIVQADHYSRTLNAWRLLWHRGLRPNDLPPILDIEGSGVAKGTNPEVLKKDLLRFLTHIELRTGRKPIIYTGLYFADQYLQDPAFAQYPLWLAEYTDNNSPKLPKTWQKQGYKFWQKSYRYSIESEKTDYDIFNGSLEELENGGL